MKWFWFWNRDYERYRDIILNEHVKNSLTSGTIPVGISKEISDVYLQNRPKAIDFPLEKYTFSQLQKESEVIQINKQLDYLQFLILFPHLLRVVEVIIYQSRNK